MSTSTVESLDVGSKGYPSSSLNNLTAHPFVLDSNDCGSMEGFLQSLKFDNPIVQKDVCKLSGIAAKNRGKTRDNWKLHRKLWWLGDPYDRFGDEYQHLLDRAYLELARQSAKFREALLATGKSAITYTEGKSKEAETPLTQDEFCHRLIRLRTLLAAGSDLSHVSRL